MRSRIIGYGNDRGWSPLGIGADLGRVDRQGRFHAIGRDADENLEIVQELHVRSRIAGFNRQLRGRAFEAASFIGLAVGRERFAPYAQEICEQLVATDFSASSDDPQVALLISSAARLAELLVGPRATPRRARPTWTKSWPPPIETFTSCLITCPLRFQQPVGR